MIEILGLIARVAFGVLLEVVWFWDPSGRRKYRDYLQAIPAGWTPLSKREWKAAGKPERPEDVPPPTRSTEVR